MKRKNHIGSALLCLMLVTRALPGNGQDSLVTILDKDQYVQGDSILAEIYTEPYRKDATAQTLHLWIDNIKTGQRWKFRYPFLKGRCSIALKLGKDIPSGSYALNFLLQDRFLQVNGTIRSEEKSDSSINYLAKARGKGVVIESAPLYAGGQFRIEGLFFTDSVLFSFSPARQKKSSKLRIELETPLDSAFTPVAAATEFIRVGKADEAGNARQGYVFDPSDKRLLQEITLRTKTKKKIDEYSERNVSGLFSNENAETIDFLDSEEGQSFTDLFTYLTYKIPVLKQQTNPENGQPFLSYRNEIVDIYVDEILDTDFSQSRISIQDIALVKFYPQSLRVGGGINDSGSGGSIAIYSRQPQDRKGNRLGNYTFYVKGYSAFSAVWK